MSPYVVAHVAVSVEGATDGFQPDLGCFYTLAGTWSEDLTLVGADTILAQEAALAAAPGPGPAPAGPLLAVVDGRARVRQWAALRDAGHWSDVVALHAAATPPRPPGRAGSGRRSSWVPTASTWLRRCRPSRGAGSRRYASTAAEP